MVFLVLFACALQLLFFFLTHFCVLLNSAQVPVAPRNYLNIDDKLAYLATKCKLGDYTVFWFKCMNLKR